LLIFDCFNEILKYNFALFQALDVASGDPLATNDGTPIPPEFVAAVNETISTQAVGGVSIAEWMEAISDLVDATVASFVPVQPTILPDAPKIKLLPNVTDTDSGMQQLPQQLKRRSVHSSALQKIKEKLKRKVKEVPTINAAAKGELHLFETKAGFLHILIPNDLPPEMKDMYNELMLTRLNPEYVSKALQLSDNGVRYIFEEETRKMFLLVTPSTPRQ
jgi:hypothetical protein